MKKFQKIFLENAGGIFIQFPLEGLKKVVNLHKSNIFSHEALKL